MTLDHWLVARLAMDLNVFLRDARIDALATLPKGVIFFCYRRGAHVALHAVVDSNDPRVCAYECARPENKSSAGGWLGDSAGLLRRARIEAVTAVPHDRVLLVDLFSRSAFGLPSRSRIVFELQPRKANALVLRISSEDGRWIVVAAQKQFAASEARRVRVGFPYELPPPRMSKLDRARFIIASRELASDQAARWERLLSAYDPDCTPALAKEVLRRASLSAEERNNAHACIEAWEGVRREVRDALERSGDVYAWREEGRLTGCHLIPLTWPSGTMVVERTINEICVESLRHEPAARSDSERQGLRKKLVTMLARCDAQERALQQSLQRAEEAERWRQAGDAIYAYLHDVTRGSAEFTTPEGFRIPLDPLLTPKDNAAEYFRKYKKARSGAAPMRARIQTLRNNREFWEHLAWELDREDLTPAQSQSVLADVREALGSNVGSRIRPNIGSRVHSRPNVGSRIHSRPRKSQAKAVPLQRIELSGGAHAYVGRSPKENERLTFIVAGPNDYWFHARGIPGAHVIVKPAGSALDEQQINEAAVLAARHSRAAGSKSVEVDYTRRKNVRRRAAGRPGLVWYTKFSTTRVSV